MRSWRIAEFKSCAGSSSLPISRTNVCADSVGRPARRGQSRALPRLLPTGHIHKGVFEAPALLDIRFRDLARDIAHAAEILGALGDANGAARIEDIEEMGAFEVVVVRGDDELRIQTAARFAFIGVIDAFQRIDIGDVEVIFAVLDLRLEQHIPIAHAGAEIHFPDAVRALQGEGDAVEAVGDFDGDGIELRAARLLEVGELGDLLAVEPHFPTKAPGAEGGAFPVVFDEADIMLAGIDADRFEALEIGFLRVAGIGFEDDLQLEVHLHAVGVVAETAVVGADARFDIDHIPRLRPQNAQRGRRVHRPRADLHIVRLLDQAALPFPIAQQAHDNLLKAQFLAHKIPCSIFVAIAFAIAIAFVFEKINRGL